jgi:hypothetical protein
MPTSAVKRTKKAIWYLFIIVPIICFIEKSPRINLIFEAFLAADFAAVTIASLTNAEIRDESYHSLKKILTSGKNKKIINVFKRNLLPEDLSNAQL